MHHAQLQYEELLKIKNIGTLGKAFWIGTNQKTLFEWSFWEGVECLELLLEMALWNSNHKRDYHITRS